MIEAKRAGYRVVVLNLCTLFGASSRRRSQVKVQPALLSIAAVIVAAMLGADSPGAEEISAAFSPQALQEIARVEVEIDCQFTWQFDLLGLIIQRNCQPLERLHSMHDVRQPALFTASNIGTPTNPRLPFCAIHHQDNELKLIGCKHSADRLLPLCGTTSRGRVPHAASGNTIGMRNLRGKPKLGPL
jgi:hypothetical protein